MNASKTSTPLCRDHTVRKLLSAVFAVALFFAGMVSPAYAATTRLQNSAFYKGIMDLLQDISLAVTLAGPLICTIAAGVFFARKSMSDDQDDKMWNRRIVKALICAVAIGLVSGMITLLIGYFNPATP